MNKPKAATLANAPADSSAALVRIVRDPAGIVAGEMTVLEFLKGMARREFADGLTFEFLREWYTLLPQNYPCQYQRVQNESGSIVLNWRHWAGVDWKEIKESV